jgi:hypothetical protein
MKMLHARNAGVLRIFLCFLFWGGLACEGKKSQLESRDQFVLDSLNLVDSAVGKAVTERIAFLERSEMADTTRWKHLFGWGTWECLPSYEQSNCIPPRMIDKQILTVHTLGRVQGYEFSQYISGRSIPTWDEEVLELEITNLCEYLELEYDFRMRKNRCTLFSIYDETDHAIGGLSIIPVTSTQADSILSAWGIQDRMHPRDGELMGIEGAYR